MRYLWIEKQSKKKLIVFFNGWSMDENPFKFLTSGDFDVCMLYDYYDLTLNQNLVNEINSYEQIYVVAWSMGVWAGSKVAFALKKPQKSIAINGTLLPIDDKAGIPAKIYDFTLKTMSQESRKAFWANMFNENNDFEKFLINYPKRALDNQIGELSSIKALCLGECSSNFKFDSALVGKFDKIFRFKNQMRFWAPFLEPKVLESGHFPFYLYKSWAEIIYADER